jgi:hypothetical protein
MKPVASLFSPLLVIPLSWALLQQQQGAAELGTTELVSAVLGGLGSLLLTMKSCAASRPSGELPRVQAETASSSAAQAGMSAAFVTIMFCYALWNTLQRASYQAYAVNEFEWIVLDKVVGMVWIYMFFLLIDNSACLQRQLHAADTYVAFSESCSKAFEETRTPSGVAWVVFFSLMQYARMGLTYVFLASDDVHLAVASFMVSITRVFSAGVISILVIILIPSFLQMTKKEVQASTSRRTLAVKVAGLALIAAGESVIKC